MLPNVSNVVNLGTVSCEDIDECDTRQDVCKGPYEKCENLHGSFLCVCQHTGLERVFDEQPCSDIDECESATVTISAGA